MNKKAISFVEIIISISIIVLLASIWLSYKASYDDHKFNTKVESDLATLNNSFLSYKQENSTLPVAKSNDNFFKSDSSYAHDASDDAFWVYGYVTSNLIPKRYLAYLPLDPRTNQFYAYWKTLDPKNLQFEFAWVITNNNKSSTMVTWDYSWEKTVWLIREYNWPQFLYNKTDSHFPYNPNERLMTAKIGSYSGTVSINWKSNNILNQTLVAWDKIKVWDNSFANIYYSDGSRSTLEKNSSLVLTKMNYPSDSNSNLITKIKLTLNNWTIWTKATKLNPAWSEFEVSTQDATAAVRWTIFKVQKDPSSNTIVEVDKWEVEVVNNINPTIKKTLSSQQKITSTTNTITSPATASITTSNDEILLPSNIKPEIEKITTNTSVKTIAIKQAKAWDIIQNKNWNQIWTCTNTWCTINNSTIKEIKFCRAIWKDNWIIKYNCSKKIDLAKNYAKKDLIANKLKNLEEDGNEQWCTWIKVDWKCYPLYAKADFNDCNSIENKNYYYTTEHWNDNIFDETLFKLKFSNWDTKPWYSNFGFASWNWWKNWNWDTSKATCQTIWTIKWFKIDNVWTSEYLKYTLLNLWDNFAIEMSVKGSDLRRSSWTYYLFNDLWNNLKLNLYNWELQFTKTSSPYNWPEISSSYLSSLANDTFYKVIAIKNWTNLKLQIKDNFWNLIISTSATLSTDISLDDDIYIWSKFNSTYQWNWIIDYVKIYKKD